MIVFESKLAKKYALAFLNVCTKEKILVQTEVLAAFHDFVTSNKVFQATLNLPSLSTIKKHNLIKLVSKKLQLSEHMIQLTVMLLKHKRIDLLGDVLKKILALHKEQQKKHHFFVATSHNLTEREKADILKFIESLTQQEESFHKYKVTVSFGVDRSLISGIRIKGNTLLWERSIAKQLRTIEQKILRWNNPTHGRG